MDDRRPRRHEETFQERKGEAEETSATLSNFRSVERQSHHRMISSGLKRASFPQTSHSPVGPKLELLPPEKILLGAAFVVAAILLVVVLLLLISWPA